MIDHIGFGVRDYEKSKAFYDSTLAPLGITMLMEVGAAETGNNSACGYGKDGKPFFWISDEEKIGEPIHVALAAPDRKTVDLFYKAAIAAGGKDNGAPGIREIYHPNYYGAFVRDPDGNNIEAVCHKPE
jgi:catechol 2,3-dioxygenase-like lactoylglutathione lyase family enzyme